MTIPSDYYYARTLLGIATGDFGSQSACTTTKSDGGECTAEHECEQWRYGRDRRWDCGHDAAWVSAVDAFEAVSVEEE